MIPKDPACGQTRSSRQFTHLLQTPDTFVRTPLPEIVRGAAIVHASPALGAEFLWFTAELEPGGTLAPSVHSRFFYVLEGRGTLSGSEGSSSVGAGDFAYAPPGEALQLNAISTLRCAVLDKRYEPLPGMGLPPAFIGSEDTLPPQPLGSCQDIEVRCMVPSGFAYDFAVNTMTYAPGAALPQVEIHYMEHGLLMLSGSGMYRLGEATYQVESADFIWMGAYCPQWFEASANGPAKYLIYKNFNRVPAL